MCSLIVFHLCMASEKGFQVLTISMLNKIFPLIYVISHNNPIILTWPFVWSAAINYQIMARFCASVTITIRRRKLGRSKLQIRLLVPRRYSKILEALLVPSCVRRCCLHMKELNAQTYVDSRSLSKKSSL